MTRATKKTPTDPVTPEAIEHCIQVLKRLTADPTHLGRVDPALRIELMKAAGYVSKPTILERRKITRTARKLRREKRMQHDRKMRQKTGVREARQSSVFTEPKQIEVAQDSVRTLEEPQYCYICKVHGTKIHFFYDSMCPACGQFNYQKRFQSASLEGRTALVTGGRVKIGYQTALKLLRAGARTIVSTRFPNDAAQRFSREEDFDAFKDQLQIYGLDLRHSPSVEMFARFVANTEKRLDVLVNNAAQTVRKPPGFYRHLMATESTPIRELPREQRTLLKNFDTCMRTLDQHHVTAEEENLEHSVLKAWPGKSPTIGIRASAKLSMIPYDFTEDTQSNRDVFPEGKLDADLQQIDLRTVNTWRLTLAEVSTPEMLEVHLVNAVAPFILSAKLKELMCRVPTQDKHVVNASAMEGKFTRYTKTDKHPHTNMAKAALNMLTRTSALDYVKDGIHMNAVDTGWITDEDTAELTQAKREEHDFEPPLDIVDGAARLLDPVFAGFNTGEHVWGKFLKDYIPTDW